LLRKYLILIPFSQSAENYKILIKEEIKVLKDLRPNAAGMHASVGVCNFNWWM